MDTISAPRVLNPPWASKIAWMRRATAVITTLIAGPTRIPEMPVPQGWEQVPAKGTGMGMQEIMKTTAAISPTRGLKERSSRERMFRLYNPYATKGRARTNHKAAQLNGNMPSEMCMAYTVSADSKALQNIKATKVIFIVE